MEQKTPPPAPAAVKLGIIGGDLRTLVMARALAARGFEVALYGIDETSAENFGGSTRCRDLSSAIAGSGAVILPLPATQDGTRIHCPLTRRSLYLQDVLHEMKPPQMLLAGRAGDRLPLLCEQAGLPFYDYYDREELQIANAIPTAEGALAIAMAEVPYTIRGSRCLVVGYGRVGRVLAHLLQAVGAAVTVTARRAGDLAWIKADGCCAARTEDLAQIVCGFDILFNTVPAPVFSKEVLRGIDRSTPIIDLSSAPGGIDRLYAEQNGNRTVFALSLPGKTAPVTAGHIMEESILQILKAEGVYAE